MEIDRDEMGSQGIVVKSVKPKTVTGIELGDIHEWILIEVLIRLPVKFVFKCKLVSKQWLSVISAPYFVRMYVTRASMSPHLQPWTFINYKMHVKDSRSWGIYFNHPDPFMLPGPCSEHRHGLIHNIVGVSNGLVLYGSRLLDRRRVHGLFDWYNICNPITGQWISLPPPTGTYLIDDDDIGRGFLTRVENNILTSYRIVRMGLGFKKIKMIRLDVFISEIGEWKDFSVCIDQEIEVIWFYRRPTDLNGILHTITRDHGIIAYDPYNKPDCLRFIALPGDIGLRCISQNSMGISSLLNVHQGQLRYFESSKHQNWFTGFGVWLLNDYSKGDWSLQHRINYADILYDYILSDKRLYLEPISFHPFDSDIVYLGFKDIITSYNMKTRKLVNHAGSLDVGDIIGHTEGIIYEERPRWLMTFLLMIPPWPIYIPVPTFGVVKD